VDPDADPPGDTATAQRLNAGGGRIAAAMTTAKKKSAITSLSFQSASAPTITATATIVETKARRAVETELRSDPS
jgi:hypothetical protein